MEKKLLIANWKSNPAKIEEAAELARQTERAASAAPSDVAVVIAPPFVFLEAVKKEIGRTKLGAQNLFSKDGGAYTGEISAGQLKSLGVEYVIIGHSERRRYLDEKDEFINEKVKLALGAGFAAVLCVGEPLEIRQRGLDAVREFIGGQLKLDLAGATGERLIVAYEPIWAIGSGQSDRPEDTAEVARFIKAEVIKLGFAESAVLYGGSVKSQNAASFLSLPEIAGALIGGASLNAEEFGEIIKAVS